MGLVRFPVSPTAESRDAAGTEDYRKKSSIPIQQIRTISKSLDDRETDGDMAAKATFSPTPGQQYIDSKEGRAMMTLPFCSLN
jgi:hypothetical protein